MLLHTAALQQRGVQPRAPHLSPLPGGCRSGGAPLAPAPTGRRAGRAPLVDGGGVHTARGSRGRAAGECRHAPRSPRWRSLPLVYDARHGPATAPQQGMPPVTMPCVRIRQTPRQAGKPHYHARPSMQIHKAT